MSALIEAAIEAASRAEERQDQDTRPDVHPEPVKVPRLGVGCCPDTRKRSVLEDAR